MNLVFTFLLLIQSSDTERQLSVKHIPAEQRQNYVNVTSFVLNSISRQPEIVKPKLEGDFIKFDLDDYGISVKEFDALPWPHEKRADWFIVNALDAPNYYKLLGIKTLDDYRKLVCLNEKEASRVGAVKKAVVMYGTVASHGQLYTRYGTCFGAVWELAEYRTNNLLKILDYGKDHKKDYKFLFGAMPNGMIAYVYVDANDKIQDYGNPDMMMDFNSPNNDARFRIARSCITFHQGFDNFEDEIRKLFKNNIAIASPDRKRSDNLRNWYGGDIKSFQKRDQSQYEEALKAANGLSAKDNARLILKIHEEYNMPITPKKGAQELGISVEKLKEICKSTHCPHCLYLLKDVPMRRDVWEENYKMLHTLANKN